MGEGGPGKNGVRRRRPLHHGAARRSGHILIRIAPGDVGLFRFLLEAYDNLALFTVLDSRAALLKLVFSPHQEKDVRAALADMGETVPFAAEAWPFRQDEGYAVGSR